MNEDVPDCNTLYTVVVTAYAKALAMWIDQAVLVKYRDEAAAAVRTSTLTPDENPDKNGPPKV